MKKWMMKHRNKLNGLATFAMAFVVLASNSRCSFCFHQPKLPKSADKYRRHIR